jgi:hypothetical protein
MLTRGIQERCITQSPRQVILIKVKFQSSESVLKFDYLFSLYNIVLVESMKLIVYACVCVSYWQHVQGTWARVRASVLFACLFTPPQPPSCLYVRAPERRPSVLEDSIGFAPIKYPQGSIPPELRVVCLILVFFYLVATWVQIVDCLGVPHSGNRAIDSLLSVPECACARLPYHVHSISSQNIILLLVGDADGTMHTRFRRHILACCTIE